jgi:hypothetical protein
MKKKLHTIQIDKGYKIKLRLTRWIKTSYGVIWLASVVGAKSNRQINDWFSRKTKRKSVKQLDNNLTSLLGNKGHHLVIQQVRKWCDELPRGDMIVFRCESAEAEKQFRVWGRWLLTKEKNYRWVPNESFLSFYFNKV